MTLVIDASNYRDIRRETENRLKLSGATIQDGCLPRKTPYGAHHDAPRATRYLNPIPRSEWPRLIEEGAGSWISDLNDGRLPCHDQAQTNYCWAHGPARAIELGNLWENMPPLLYSAESVAVPVTGGRNRGGTTDESLDQIRDHGIAPQSYWPINDRNANHAQIGWQDAAAKTRFLHWMDVLGFDVQMTLALHRIPLPLPLSWWGHLVCQTDPVMFPDETFGIKFDNSYGPNWGDNGSGILTEDKGTAEWPTYCPLYTTFLANFEPFDPEAGLHPQAP